jgi:hypothetical protein
MDEAGVRLDEAGFRQDEAGWVGVRQKETRVRVK